MLTNKQVKEHLAKVGFEGLTADYVNKLSRNQKAGILRLRREWLAYERMSAKKELLKTQRIITATKYYFLNKERICEKRRKRYAEDAEFRSKSLLKTKIWRRRMRTKAKNITKK